MKNGDGYVTVNNVNFYALAACSFKFDYYKDDTNIKFYYSFDGNNYEETTVYRHDYIAQLGSVAIAFQMKDFVDFLKRCSKGRSIYFKIENSKGYAWKKFYLYGFTNAYNHATQIMSYK